MDRYDLVEGLNRAFHPEDAQRSDADAGDVEYREHTNTLLVKKHKTYDMSEEQQEFQMSEEELFDRLLKERRQ